MFVLHEPREFTFDKNGHKGKYLTNFQTLSSTQFVLIEAENGIESYLVEQASDFVYYILEGNGYFEVNGEKEECTSGDLVVIPKGNKFIYKGHLKMLLSCTPPWTEGQEIETKE